MSIVDPERVASIVREVAQTVILPRYKRLTDQEIREKKPGDLVTVADTEAEWLLSRRLGELLPWSSVVGEESVAADPLVLNRLNGDGPIWIIDPVDGTSNFAHGRALFAVIVALVQRGQTVQGWIHDPLSGRTAMAETGAGAWIGGQRLKVSPEGPIAAMTGSARHRNEKLTKAVRKVVRHGSAGHDYLALVEARIQFAHFGRLHPWDHAAGVLLHHEAGGYSALMTGQPYHPVPQTGAILLTPGEASWKALAPLV